jgi:hypothetical protein
LIRHHTLGLCWSVISSENHYTLFRIMLSTLMVRSAAMPRISNHEAVQQATMIRFDRTLYPNVIPASTTSAAPLTCAASSDVRKATTSAICSGCPLGASPARRALDA